MPHAILANLTDDERAAYLNTLTAVAYEPGAVLFEEGNPGRRFMFVTGGSAAVSVSDKNVATVESGSILGELALLRGTVRTATVTAVDQVTGYEGTINHLLDLFERSPAAGTELAEITARRIAPFAPRVEVRLPDGTSFLMRPLLPTDRDAFMHVYDSWTPRMRYLRFFSAAPPDHVLRQLIDIDYLDHFAWIAFDNENEDVCLGSARYIREGDPTSAQIAFGVAEEWQKRGVATVLIAALGAAAQINGITTFTAEVLGENIAAQRLLHRFGMVFTFGVAGELDGSMPVADPSVGLTTAEIEALTDAAALVTRAQ